MIGIPNALEDLAGALDGGVPPAAAAALLRYLATKLREHDGAGEREMWARAFAVAFADSQTATAARFADEALAEYRKRFGA